MDGIRRVLWGHRLITCLHIRLREQREREGPWWKPMDLKNAKPRTLSDVIEKDRRFKHGSQT